MKATENRSGVGRLRLLLLSSLATVLSIVMGVGGIANAGAAKLIDGSFTRLSASPKQLRWQGGDITLHIVVAPSGSKFYARPKGCQIISTTTNDLSMIKGPRPNHTQGMDTLTWVFSKCPAAVTFVVPPNNSTNAVLAHSLMDFAFVITPLRSQASSLHGFEGEIDVTQAAPPRPSPTTTTTASPAS